ncbi:MAG: hypothetical protein JNL19_08410 [Burkholderiales bacterium]|nr:hypothetical protein [Burkholderiales bacterium]
MKPHTLATVTTALALAACSHTPGAGDASAHSHGAAPEVDARAEVVFPESMRAHTLSNMRDHLKALAEIQAALAEGRYDVASSVAEQRLGMSSLKSHGAHDVARYMPVGMQAAGEAMHRSASRFAIEAQNSAATGDLKPAVHALAQVTSTCVACHAGYRLR